MSVCCAVAYPGKARGWVLLQRVAALSICACISSRLVPGASSEESGERTSLQPSTYTNNKHGLLIPSLTIGVVVVGGQIHLGAMATVRRARMAHEPVLVHDDNRYDEEETEDAMDESRGPLDESGCTHSEDSEEEVEASVAEDIQRFEQTFQNITKRYRLINRIGEGQWAACHVPAAQF